MADIEKVIRDLRYVKSFGRVSNNQQLTEIADSAIELLKEQKEENERIKRIAKEISAVAIKSTTTMTP